MGVPFKLSDPGTNLGSDPALSEYLRCYSLPTPPDVRYGYVRFESPQEKARVSLFGQAWLPAGATGTVLLTHGFSEHSANYSQLIKDFLGAKLAVAAMDLRGHGLSEGARGYVETPHTYVEDLEAFASQVISQLTPNRPLYVFGHSLGALITMQALLRGKMPMRPHAAACLSPFLGFPELNGIQKFMASLAPLLAKILPSFPVSHGLHPENLSHNKEYLSQRAQDPLIVTVATPRWLMSCRAAVAEVQSNAKEFQHLAPMLFLLAGDERITNLNDSRRFAFHALANMHHKVIEFPGYRHEIEKETEIRPRVVSECVSWFQSHA